jgi:hypothetical protein
MKYALPAAVLGAVLCLSGCAASLVYDRDRPARDCRDPQHPCPQSALPAAPDKLVLQPLAGRAG